MKKTLTLVGAGVAAFIVIIVAVIVILLQPKKINVEDYVEVTYSGYNAYATARVSLDESGLTKAILEAKGKSVDYDSIDSFESLSTALVNELTVSECIDTIELVSSKSENLSNGDVITVEITYDNEKAKEQKIKFTGESISITVEGLENAIEIDPFENLEVSFTGISPNGRLEYSYTGDNSNLSTYSFSASEMQNLKNGDKITITCNFNEQGMLSQGYVVTKPEAEYEVSGLDEYVSAYADLTADFLATMKNEAEDTIYSYVASSYNNTSSLSDLAYAGYVQSVIKDSNAYTNRFNCVYLIFSGTVSNTEGSFRTTKVYFPVRFSNILKSGEELSYGSNDGIIGRSSIGGTWYSTNGYTNPLVCYMEIVEADRDTYTSECGDGFEVYAKHEDIASLSDISDAYKQVLFTEATDMIESYIASSYPDIIVAGQVVLAGEYLLVAKSQGSDFAKNNTYIAVFSASVSNTRGSFETMTVYFPVVYNGIVSLPNGEYMVTESKGMVGYSNFPNCFYSTKGYIDGTVMFKDLVTANKDRYSYEVSDDLKVFGE